LKKPKNELFEEIKAGFFKRKKIEEENEVFLEKIKKLRVFEKFYHKKPDFSLLFYKAFR